MCRIGAFACRPQFVRFAVRVRSIGTALRSHGAPLRGYRASAFGQGDNGCGLKSWLGIWMQTRAQWFKRERRVSGGTKWRPIGRSGPRAACLVSMAGNVADLGPVGRTCPPLWPATVNVFGAPMRRSGCTQVALTSETRENAGSDRFRNHGVYVRVRTTDVRAIRLENRQSFTGLVRSNLTLSAKNNNLE